MKNNLVVWLSIIDSGYKAGYYYILQEYTTDGKLLTQTNLYEDVDNKIKNIFFDNYNNYIVLFKKSKDGWIMEKREWQ